MTAPAPKSVPLTCSGHTRPVVHLEFSDLQDDGTYTMLSSCKDGNPMLRDWLGDWIGTFLGHKGAVWSGRLSGGEASKAVTGSADFSAKVWDTYSGSCLHTFPHNHIVRATAIDFHGNKIITGGHEKKLRLFDLANPTADPQEFKSASGTQAHEGTIKSIIWGRGPHENTVISAGEDKVMRWWDLRSLAITHELKLDDPVTSMERNAGLGGEILSVTAGKDVLFMNLADGQVRKKHTLAQAPSSASLHPVRADRFVTGTVGDGWVRIFDYETGEQRELHKGHHGPAHIVSYSPDGQLAASGSEDGTIRLWQTFPGSSYGLWTS